MARISGTRTPSRTTSPKEKAKATAPKKPEAKETKSTGWKPKASVGGGGESGGGGGSVSPRSAGGGSEAGGGGGRVSVPSYSSGGGGE